MIAKYASRTVFQESNGGKSERTYKGEGGGGKDLHKGQGLGAGEKRAFENGRFKALKDNGEGHGSTGSFWGKGSRNTLWGHSSWSEGGGDRQGGAEGGKAAKPLVGEGPEGKT